MERKRTPGPNELRDHLANERTFLAWIRTALTIIALGFVVSKFGILLREVGRTTTHPLTSRLGSAVGVALVASGMITALFAALRFLQTRHDIECSIVEFSPVLDIVLAVVVGVVSAFLAVYIIVTA